MKPPPTHLHGLGRILSINGSIPSTRSKSHSRMAFPQRHRCQKEPRLLFSFLPLPLICPMAICLPIRFNAWMDS